MEHFYQGIDGWFSFAQTYSDRVAAARDGDVFVEVGCWKGRSLAYLAVEILNSGKQIELYAVDHFEGSTEITGSPSIEKGTLFTEFCTNLAPARKALSGILCCGSPAAAALFAGKPVSFVFIDGSHDYDSVRKDLEAWHAVLRNTGTIAGHDYHAYPGVKLAVDEFAIRVNKQITVIGNVWIMNPSSQ